MSDHVHITLETLAAVVADESAGRGEIEAALARSCPQCLAVLADYLGSSAAPRPSYRGMWQRLQTRLPAAVGSVRGELGKAELRFEELAALDARERRDRIDQMQDRYSGRALVERLLDAARAARSEDPRASLDWATDALVVLDREPAAAIDQMVLAVALQANAHRALDDLRAAQRAFVRSRALAIGDALDLDTQAELDRLEASLLIDLRRFDEAEALLLIALRAYQELGEVTLAAQTLLQLGHLFSTAGLPETAVGPYEAALDLLPRDREPRLHLAARFNLAHSLFELGRIIEARDLLTYDEDLYEGHADRHLAVRRLWLEAKIACATGEVARAERLLIRTRETFASRGGGFDAALVSMDLALLYQRLGRTEELLETVSAAVQLFAAYALHREGLAALVMLRDAIHQQAATAETIERVARFLRESASDPAGRFQAPS